MVVDPKWTNDYKKGGLHNMLYHMCDGDIVDCYADCGTCPFNFDKPNNFLEYLYKELSGEEYKE